MKHILTTTLTTLAVMIAAVAAVAAVAVLSSCENKKPKNQILDPLAKISIRADLDKSNHAPTRAGYPTPLEVVQKTTDIVMVSPNFPNEPWVNLGIADEQRDTANLRVLLWGMWVILDGKLNTNFIESHDMIFVTRENQLGWAPITDTLAYIPNARLRDAEIKIKAAYEAENYDEVYRLFDEAYKFVPINGADWLKLKEEAN